MQARLDAHAALIRWRPPCMHQVLDNLSTVEAEHGKRTKGQNLACLRGHWQHSQQACVQIEIPHICAMLTSAMRHRFNGEPDAVFALLMTTRAGGQGLNLTGADTVILHDVDFNPQIDRQAEDRCHRLGQTKPVTIYRLVQSNLPGAVEMSPAGPWHGSAVYHDGDTNHATFAIATGPTLAMHAMLHQGDQTWMNCTTDSQRNVHQELTCAMCNDTTACMSLFRAHCCAACSARRFTATAHGW